MKIAIVYDRVNTAYGGAEKVLLALNKLYPKAPLFTSVYDYKIAKWANVFKVIPSFLQKIPLAKKHHRLFAPLMPIAFENLDFSEFDLIISVSSAEAIGIMTLPHQLHINYLLTPPRYLFSHKKYYSQKEGILSFGLLKPFTKILINYLTSWNKLASSRPDIIIPISRLVRTRAQKYYDRFIQTPIYPPIETKNYKNTKTTNNQNSDQKYYLIISRFLHYKRIDLAIKACATINRKLIIVGSGPEEKNLKNLANKFKTNKIKFLGKQPQKIVNDLYKNCHALIMPGEEDFGITGLEANAFGKPAIVFYKSGIAELIKDKIHGIHLKKQTTKNLISSLEKLENTRYDTKILKQNAKGYDTNRFVNEFEKTIINHWNNHMEGTYVKK